MPLFWASLVGISGLGFVAIAAFWERPLVVRLRQRLEGQPSGSFLGWIPHHRLAVGAFGTFQLAVVVLFLRDLYT